MTKRFKTVLRWIVSLTWGVVMTFIGAVIALVLSLAGVQHKIFHGSVYFEVGKNWGGFSCGMFFFTSENPTLHTKQHESGHGIQNMLLGPFMVIISGWSVLRYWYREILLWSGRKVYSELPPYDSIWFEGWATRLGEKYFPEE